jgi:riboflavin synthase alpha subunit
VVEAAAPIVAVTIIPTTLGATTLGSLRPGDAVNLETDLLAKYVRRATTAVSATDADRRLLDTLGQSGFLG